MTERPAAAEQPGPSEYSIEPSGPELSRVGRPSSLDTGQQPSNNDPASGRLRQLATGGRRPCTVPLRDAHGRFVRFCGLGAAPGVSETCSLHLHARNADQHPDLALHP